MSFRNDVPATGVERQVIDFDHPETVELDRRPNEHTTFGLGGHLRAVIERMRNYVIDHDRATMFPDVGLNHGWISLLMPFMSGRKVGSDFQPEQAGAGTGAATTAAAAAMSAAATASSEIEGSDHDR